MPRLHPALMSKPRMGDVRNAVRIQKYKEVGVAAALERFRETVGIYTPATTT